MPPAAPPPPPPFLFEPQNRIEGRQNEDLGGPPIFELTREKVAVSNGLAEIFSSASEILSDQFEDTKLKVTKQTELLK